MFEYAFAVVFPEVGEVVYANDMRLIWWEMCNSMVRHSIYRSAEIYAGGKHVSTIAKRNGRVYYHRVGKLRMVDVTQMMR